MKNKLDLRKEGNNWRQIVLEEKQSGKEVMWSKSREK